jgi:hypothetical protein
VHERPPAYDHNKSAVVDRECRTLLEGTSTLLFQSGAPPSFWQEAGAYFVFVRNRLPRLETEEVGVFASSEEKLRGIVKPFNLNNFVPFGAQVNCLIPKEKRGAKTPGQEKSFEGAVIGVVEDCSAYRVWDPETKKVREVSFSFCVVSENCFPFRAKRKEKEEEPLSFFPTLEAFLTPKEWDKYGFSREQQVDVVKRKGLTRAPPPPPPPPRPGRKN